MSGFADEKLMAKIQKDWSKMSVDERLALINDQGFYGCPVGSALTRENENSVRRTSQWTDPESNIRTKT